jgi:hypothetical protein
MASHEAPIQPASRAPKTELFFKLHVIRNNLLKHRFALQYLTGDDRRSDHFHVSGVMRYALVRDTYVYFAALGTGIQGHVMKTALKAPERGNARTVWVPSSAPPDRSTRARIVLDHVSSNGRSLV